MEKNCQAGRISFSVKPESLSSLTATSGTDTDSHHGKIRCRITGRTKYPTDASTSTIPTARCGPASQVVWEGGQPPYPDLCPRIGVPRK